MYNQIKVIQIDPKIESDNNNVYFPSDDTFLFIDYFSENVNDESFDGKPLKDIKKILDLGTGTGIIAIFLELLKKKYKDFTPKIYAADILSDAIECAKKNEKLNGLDGNIEFIHSDLFTKIPKSLRNSFDIITFNPPYLPSSKLIEEEKTIDFSWVGGKKGYELTMQFLDACKEFLTINDGRLYIITSSATKLKNLYKMVKQKGFTITYLKKIHVFFEDIILNRLELKKD